MKAIMLAALLALPVLHAQAHVSLEQKSATAGSYQKLTFRVGHGCDDGAAAGATAGARSATTAITIVLPDAIGSAKPMPKAGWTLSAGAREISWRGSLPDSQFDEFNLLVKLPDAPGKHPFKVIQQCGNGRAEWAELPGVAAKFPAPVLDIVPAAATGPAPTPAAPPQLHQH